MASLNEKLFAEAPPPGPRPAPHVALAAEDAPGRPGADPVARAIVESVLRSDGG